MFDVGSDGGDHAGGLEADPVAGLVVGREHAHGGEDVAEVHPDGVQAYFDLSGPGAASWGGGQAQAVEVAESCGVQLDAVGAVVDGAGGGGGAFGVGQRHVGEVGGVAGGAAQGDLVLGWVAEEFGC